MNDSIKVEGEYGSVEELRQLVVADRRGTIISLADVGRVDDGFEDLRAIARFNGSPTVGLGIRKQPKSNLVEVADRVKARLEEIKPHLPQVISIAIAYDGSTQIKESIAGVQTDILIGILLTAAIMYLFLRTERTTVVAVVAIPVSLLGGFVVMKALGFTANNMTMLAISLAVGMVIDDAIVVIIGNEGLHFVDRKEVLLANDVEEFASRTVELYCNENLWNGLVAEARNYLTNQFSKEKARNIICQVMGITVEQCPICGKEVHSVQPAGFDKLPEGQVCAECGALKRNVH